VLSAKGIKDASALFPKAREEAEGVFHFRYFRVIREWKCLGPHHNRKTQFGMNVCGKINACQLEKWRKLMPWNSPLRAKEFSNNSTLLNSKYQ
jgi:hypothetical protein